MTVAVDLYSKKTRLYYIGLVITIVTFSFISIAAIFNLQGESPLMPLYDTMLVLASLASVTFVFIAGMGLIRTYIIDGQLIVDDKYLVIDNVRLQPDEIKSLNLRMSLRTIKSFRLIRNQIEITDRHNNIYNRRFCIKSYSNDQEFNQIIDSWRKRGVDIDVSYHN